MPIAVRVTSQGDLKAWAAKAKQEFAADKSTAPTTVAAAGTPAMTFSPAFRLRRRR